MVVLFTESSFVKNLHFINASASFACLRFSDQIASETKVWFIVGHIVTLAATFGCSLITLDHRVDKKCRVTTQFKTEAIFG